MDSIYINMPKCGSLTVREIGLKTVCYERDRDIFLKLYNPHVIEKIPPEKKLITMTRHPYNRIFSGYLWLKKQGDPTIGNKNFLEFIKNIELTNFKGQNKHIFKMCDFIPDNIDIKIFKLEEIEKLYEFLGINNTEINENCRTYSEKIIKKELTRECKDIINRLYHEDFVKFNYKKE